MTNRKYLTIGEVSKASRTHIKSLRYYDRIGVLKPAYTDPDTGYRYYLPSQLAYLEAIRFCIEIGIPLKEFGSYISGELINTQNLLCNAEETALVKMHSIEQGLELIRDMKRQIQNNEELRAAGGNIKYSIPSKHYAVIQLSENYNDEIFSILLSNLQLKITERGCRPGFDFGKLYIFFENSPKPKKYIYCDVFGDNADTFITFSEMTCTATTAEHATIDNAPDYFDELFNMKGTKFVFETEMISNVYDTENPMHELRCAVVESINCPIMAESID